MGEMPVVNFIRIVRKVFISAFVVVTFAAYVLHERAVNPDGQSRVAFMPVAPISEPVQAASAPLPSSPLPTSSPLPVNPATNPLPTPTSTSSVLVVAPTPVATSTPQSLPASAAANLIAQAPTAAIPTVAVPTVEIPTPTAEVKGQYRNGEYTGPEVNAVYGWVQVAAVVQNGQITDIQLLDYPQDRRTSVRINSRAVPYLQSEAIQAQSAHVNIVSGATLTSRAFIQSLQSALDVAVQ